MDTRREVTKRALKAVRQLSERARKKGGGDESGQLPENSAARFDEALAHLQQSLAHLDSLRHPFIASLKSSEQVMRKRTFSTSSSSASLPVRQGSGKIERWTERGRRRRPERTRAWDEEREG